MVIFIFSLNPNHGFVQGCFWVRNVSQVSNMAHGPLVGFDSLKQNFTKEMIAFLSFTVNILKKPNNTAHTNDVTLIYMC